jgi:hypothetical protein
MTKWWPVVAAVAMSACGPAAPEEAGGLNGFRTFNCNGRMAFPDGSSLGLSHVVYAFPDASVMTVCTAVYLDDQPNGIFLYRSTDIGAPTGECVVVTNAEGEASPGYLLFRTNATRTSSTVVYNDKDLKNGVLTSVISCSEVK